MRFRFPRATSLLVPLAVAAAVAVPIALAGSVTEMTPLSPAPSAENGQMTAEVPGAWFVELAGKPLARGGDKSALKAEKQAFRDALKAAGVSYSERYAFDSLWNGFSLQIGAVSAGKLTAISGVKAVYPVLSVPAPETETTPDLATALAMTGADIAQSELGYTGAGVKVAVMDTGFDLDHPDLGGDGTNGAPYENPRVVAQWDFVGDDYNADPSSTAYQPVPHPDAIADDCNGHGTHVSGIVGANGAVKGVAPDVKFGAYRVFGCAGSTEADIMIAAMERALADDMDVLNMSIGSAFQTWPQYPTGSASDALVDAGMSVVASIGNSGANGTYSAGSPGVGNNVIGTASFENSHVALTTFTVTPAGLTIGYGNAAGAPTAPTTGSLPLAKTGTPTTANDACAPPAAGSMTGKAVLIRRGTCSFYIKASNAQAAGASAVVLYNNSAGRFSPTVAGTPPITIPVVAISDTEGVAINNAIDAGAQTLNWQATTGTFVNPTGGLISSFSSFGLNAELTLKPDIGAPGGLIRSTYPLESGAYATVSGTSMASPHVAGGVALYLQAHPGTQADRIRSILQNSADPKNWWGNPGLGFLDNVHRQGAGMLDIDDAILATTSITPGKLSLGEGAAGPQTKTLAAHNHGASAVTYDLSFVNALSTAGTNTVSYTTSNASVAFSSSSLTVPAGGSATVDATITPASAPDKAQYGGYIVFTPRGGGQVYRVPFAGFVGDYQSIVLFGGSFGAPLLGKLASCTPAVTLRGLDCFGTGSYSVLPAGDTFDLTNAIGETPYALVHLEHQARRLEIEVLRANGQKVHPVFSNTLETDFLPRNSTSTSFFAFPWDGTRLHDNGGGNGDHKKVVPDGQYKLVVKALKALGDRNNPSHWETWTSPTFTIDRP
jgi:subtilisin family serine protease